MRERWIATLLVVAVGVVASGLRCRRVPAGAGEPDRPHRRRPLGPRRSVRTLLDGGAPIDGRDADGATALLAAVGSGHDGVALLLAERGADIDAPAANSDTLGFSQGPRAELRHSARTVRKAPISGCEIALAGMP